MSVALRFLRKACPNSEVRGVGLGSKIAKVGANALACLRRWNAFS